MTDTPGSNPVPDNPDEDAAHKARMKELFGDIDDEEAEETLESVRAERDALRQTVADLGASLRNSQQDNLTLTRQMAEQREEAARILARVQKQTEDQKAFALEKFVKEVLPVIDNLERALAAIPATQRAADTKFDKHAQGIEKTLGQLSAVFNKFGLKAINPCGECFDPNKHEAITTRDDEGFESDTVVEVAQKGYELNGRVIRPAKVIVKP